MIIRTKIDELHASGPREQHILSLDVSVQHTAGMEVAQASYHFPQDIRYQVFGEPLPFLFHHFGKVGHRPSRTVLYSNM